jgi:hypothetical protein
MVADGLADHGENLLRVDSRFNASETLLPVFSGPPLRRQPVQCWETQSESGLIIAKPAILL